MKPANQSSPGLHLAVALADLGEEPARYHVIANTAERTALAERFGLTALVAMVADVSVARLHGGAALRVEGRIQAHLTQPCVVTLEPVDQHIDDSFRLDFGEPADVVDAETGELVLSADDPEPMPRGELDLGELLAEHLALAIDPYPRKPDVDLEKVLQGSGIEVEGAKANPFAVLAGLKDKS
jgi:uncharacterized metal-binding protein YceD (DUF177 family)